MQPSSPASPDSFRDDLLTVAEVASWLRVNRATVWRRVAAGALPDPFYVGDRSPRWSASEVDEAIRARRLSPKAAMAARQSTRRRLR